MAQRQTDLTPLFLIGGGILLFWWLRPTAGTGRITMTKPEGQVPGVAPPTSLPRQAIGGSNQVRWIQNSLNQLIGANLKVDGIFGSLTKAAVIRFQQIWQITTDGIVGPETEYALRSALGQPGYVEQPYTKPQVWY